uniref:Uncharacterized protein n=1 Tax=Arundo donax TaxID=35708 RepID=A0A0A8ZJZ3_ARUDO
MVGNGGLMSELIVCGSDTSSSPQTSVPISFSSCSPWRYNKLGCTARCASLNCSTVGLISVCTSNLPDEPSSGKGYDSRTRFTSCANRAGVRCFSANFPHSTARSVEFCREVLWI